MKKVLLALITLVCLGCMVVCTTGCSTVTPQQKFDELAAVEMDNYTFKFVATQEEIDADERNDESDYVLWDSTTEALRKGEAADRYIVATDEESNKDLVYLYTDISYDPQSTYRYFDLYTPQPKESLNPATPVFLYLHGGGWVAGNRRGECLSLVPYLVEAGFVVISMEYGLWFGMNQRDSDLIEKGVYWFSDLSFNEILTIMLGNKHPVSVYDMMEDIDTCLAFLKTYLADELHLDCHKIGIGGYSAGGHLTTLYSYHYADQSPIPLAFELDLVGPVNLLDEGYMHVARMLLGKDENGNKVKIKTNNIKVKTVMNLLTDPANHVAEALQGIVGADQPVDITTSDGWALAEKLLGNVSGYSYLDENSIPTIICYAKSHPESAKFMENIFPDDFDLFIPITIYRRMSEKLDEVGIVHADRLFEDLHHNNISKETKSCKWMAEQCHAMAELYCY